MTRFAWLAAALLALPVGCTLLADNALPDDGTGGGAQGGSGATGGSGGTASGTGSGTGGSGGAEEICFNGIDDDNDGEADCGDTSCGGTCETLPDDAVVAFVSPNGSCPDGYELQMRSECADCACDAATADGTCNWEYKLYTTGACVEPPALVGTSISTDCSNTPAAPMLFNADNGETVGAKGTMVPALDATCPPSEANVTPVTRSLCVTNAIGCASDSLCVPPTTEPLCLLYDGDAACPASHPNAQRLFDGGGMCDCACATGSQSCPVGVDLHMYPQLACGGPKVDLVEPDDMCQNLMMSTVGSVEQHTDVLNATAATCSPTGDVPGATLQTLCCE